MAKEQANFRIDADIKEKAYEVLSQLGMRPTDAVNMFMHHIALFKELPFKPGLPNAETQDTFAKTDAGEDMTEHQTVDGIFENI